MSKNDKNKKKLTFAEIIKEVDDDQIAIEVLFNNNGNTLSLIGSELTGLSEDTWTKIAENTVFPKLRKEAFIKVVEESTLPWETLSVYLPSTPDNMNLTFIAAELLIERKWTKYATDFNNYVEMIDTLTKLNNLKWYKEKIQPAVDELFQEATGFCEDPDDLIYLMKKAKLCTNVPLLFDEISKSLDCLSFKIEEYRQIYDNIPSLDEEFDYGYRNIEKLQKAIDSMIEIKFEKMRKTAKCTNDYCVIFKYSKHQDDIDLAIEKATCLDDIELIEKTLTIALGINITKMDASTVSKILDKKTDYSNGVKYLESIYKDPNTTIDTRRKVVIKINKVLTSQKA